jgi:hypothetical protein
MQNSSSAIFLLCMGIIKKRIFEKKERQEEMKNEHMPFTSNTVEPWKLR